MTSQLSPKPLRPIALTIAGSDSGGGAGIQADLKTFTALGVFGASVITALTAQNTLGVQAIHAVPLDFIARQFDSVCSDLPPRAAKTGMLATSEVIELVAAKVREHKIPNLVVDTVMVAKSGDRLLVPEAREALARILLPLAALITPNIGEVKELTGLEVRGEEDMREAARKLHALGARNVLVKGGHLTGEALDLLYDGRDFHPLRGVRVETSHTHGTG